MSLKRIPIAFYILAVLLFGSARVAHAQNRAHPDLQVQIKKVEYKELKAGKHHLLVNWDVDLTKCGKNCRVTRVVIDVELTDAKGEKRKATRTLSAGGGSGKVSVTPIPIPKELILDVAATKLFGGHTDPLPDDQAQLQFALQVSVSVFQENELTRSQVERRTGKVIARNSGRLSS